MVPSRFVILATDDAHQQHRQLQLVVDSELTFGRLPDNELALPWDQTISRHHGTIRVGQDSITIRCHQSAVNSIQFQGSHLRQLILDGPGEFAIGRTKFFLTCSGWSSMFLTDTKESAAEPPLLDQLTFTVGELRAAARDAPEKELQALAKIPGLVESSKGGQELAEQLARLLLQTQPRADAAAVVQFQQPDRDNRRTNVGNDYVATHVAFDVRNSLQAEFRPSRRIMAAALQTRKTTVHSWASGADSGLDATLTDGLSWAIAVPVQADEISWCVYVSGPGVISHRDQLAADCRFIELVGEFLRSITIANQYHERKTAMMSFLSPKIAEKVLAAPSVQSLAPKESVLSVLFCDLRGFSRVSEQHRGDLLGLYHKIQSALNVMTSGILDADGAIADFQGDAALGFWGWPIADDLPAIRAVAAAMSISKEFAARRMDGEQEAFENLSLGMGIATGIALAGQIGTSRQSKIGVFGPVVNQGARLEGLSKMFGCQLCFDQETANQLQTAENPPSCSVRHLGVVQPAGMDGNFDVFSLVTTDEEHRTTELDVVNGYQQAWQEFSAGNWQVAKKLLAPLAGHDHPSSFLFNYLELTGPTAPSEGDCVIRLENKK